MLLVVSMLLAAGGAAALAGWGTGIGAPASASRPGPSAPYRGVGTWLDIYDHQSLWRDLPGTVARMKSAGVRTVYVETANYRQSDRRLVVRPAALAQLIDVAHRAGLLVVGWYLPGLKNVALDLARVRAALGLMTSSGGRFDGFALDLESSLVTSIARRDAAAIDLSRTVRSQVGRGYSLGAIVPDARSTSPGGLWPGFPFRGLRPAYDVFLPMAYSTFRTSGVGNVRAYTLDSIRRLRQQTGDVHLPVHVIGGLAHRLPRGEARAVVGAASATHALGASFYSFASTTPAEWESLRSLEPVPGAGQPVNKVGGP